MLTIETLILCKMIIICLYTVLISSLFLFDPKWLKINLNLLETLSTSSIPGRCGIANLNNQVAGCHILVV